MSSRFAAPRSGPFVLSLALFVAPSLSLAAESLSLPLRSRHQLAPDSGRFEVVERAAQWKTAETAVIVCDVWDKHWCNSANTRLATLLPRINKTLEALRGQGVLVIHAPSETMKFYEGASQRDLARNAPKAQPPEPRSLPKEPRLPIDDSDGGCDCQPQCQQRQAWSREHAAITMGPGDAISDSGAEIYNLLAFRGIKHVLVLGVHTNMCILGRPFAIRQLLRWGFDVALVRDLTDTMYNSRRAPVVPHNKGTDLVIEHIEKYLCPSVRSADILHDAQPPRIAIAIGEDEYEADVTLPAFAKAEFERLGYKYTILQANKEKTDLPNISALDTADLLILFFRRTTLPPEQLARFKAYFEAGKPVVALRTSCHSFQNYLEFDREVLDCHYTGHYGTSTGVTEIKPAPSAVHDPVLRGVIPPEFKSASWLYKLTPLAPTATLLLTGQATGTPVEPLAWTTTHRGGRVFFTSLGHPDDFKSPAFRRLLLNAVEYALDHPISMPGTPATDPSGSRPAP